MNSKSFFLLVLTVLAGNLAVHAQSTAFTYQGRLDSSGSPSTGGYDLRVAVFDARDEIEIIFRLLDRRHEEVQPTVPRLDAQRGANDPRGGFLN